MKIAGKVDGINEERRIRDISGTGGQRGGAAIGERAQDAVITARGSAVVENDEFFGSHTVEPAAVTTAETGTGCVIAKDRALRNAAAVSATSVQGEIVVYVAV